MRKLSIGIWCTAAIAGALGGASQIVAQEPPTLDFGAFVQHQLNARAPQLFGIVHPLDESALGPYTGANSTQAVVAAQSLQVSLVSNALHANADMIALWPDDENPTHLFVCVESGTSAPAVQRIDLSKPVDANATTILTGLSSCDPIHRTPWGTIVAAEEAGANGGLYEILNPADITTPVAVTNRNTGATSPAGFVFKRQVVGALSWEGNVILDDGLMYMGDELRPGGGNGGGAIYKFVPDFPFSGGSIANPADSPFASGRLYGLRVGSTDYGQGTEIGQGAWVEIDPATYADANGNVILRNAQLALKLTGYYRPEDMDLDPIAAARGEARACWTNTGRMTNGGGSAVEAGAIYGEVMCLTDRPKAMAAAGAVPQVVRFIAGDTQANHFDNAAFQPHTGNLALLEDGEVEVVRPDGTTELRGNDIWMCLPDGADRDVQSDGCIRIMSLRDTDSEPTGFVFTASGRTAFVNLQHRSTGQGALLRISGFRVE